MRRSSSLANVSLLEHSSCDSKNGEPPVQHDCVVAIWTRAAAAAAPPVVVLKV